MDEFAIENALNEVSEEFEMLVVERLKKGQEEYGVFTFLGNDVVRMMLEELADTVNYCRMQGVKLLMLQRMLETDWDEARPKNEDGRDDLQIGFDSFKGTKDVGWGKKT